MAAHFVGFSAILLFLVRLSAQDQISDKRLCGNKFCTVTLSLARAVADFDGTAEDHRFLKFKEKDVVRITSKSAGSRTDLWGGEVQGRQGFFPKSLVQEFKVLYHNPATIVAIEKKPANDEKSTDEGAYGKEKKHDDDDDETDLDEVELDVIDGVLDASKAKDVPKNEPAPETKPSEESGQKQEKPVAPEEKPATQAGTKQVPDENKDVDDTDLDDTDITDPTEVKEGEKPAETADKPPEQTPETIAGKTAEKPAGDVPVENPTSDKPAEQMEKPTEPMEKPVEQADKPAEQVDKPAAQVDKPAEQVDKLAEQVDKLAEQADKLAEQVDKPVEQAEKPAEQAGKPAEQAEKLAEQIGKPAEQADNLTEQAEKPAEQAEKPAEQIAKPVEELVKPAEPVEKPADQVEKPVQQEVKQAEAQDAPAEHQKPVEDKVVEPQDRLADPQDVKPTEPDGQPEPKEAKQTETVPAKQEDKPESPPVEKPPEPSDKEKTPVATPSKEPDLPVETEPPAEQGQIPPDDATKDPQKAAEMPKVKVEEIRVTIPEGGAAQKMDDHLDVKQQQFDGKMEGDVEKRGEPVRNSTGEAEAKQLKVDDIIGNDPEVLKLMPKIGKITDEKLKELRAQYVKRRLASVGQPTVQHVPSDEGVVKKPEDTKPADQDRKPEQQEAQAKPEAAAVKPEGGPTTGPQHPPPTDTMNPSATEKAMPTPLPPQQPKQPSVSDHDKHQAQEDIQTPRLEPSKPMDEVESTALSQDELASQKLLEELEKATTPLPGNILTETISEQPQEATKPQSVQPSLPHSMPQETPIKETRAPRRPVMPRQKTVTVTPKKEPVPSQKVPVGSVVKDSVQQTPSVGMPKETQIPDVKLDSQEPKAPQAGENITPPTDSVPTTDSTPMEPESPHPPPTESSPETSTTMSTLTKAAEPLVNVIISSLPDDWRQVLEKEPIGLPPTHTVLFLLICLIFSIIVSLKCICSGGDKVSAKLKERVTKAEYDLFLVSKEKESLTQSIQEAEDKATTAESKMYTVEETNKRLQVDVSNLQLHNSALKKSVQTLEEQVSTLTQSIETIQASFTQKEQESLEYQNQLYQLQEHTAQLEYQLQQSHSVLTEKVSSAEQLEGSNSALNEEITLLHQSKQLLLKEAEDWHEKVKELEESMTTLQSQTKELQDGVSFKENEIEVLKDCFMQLKVLETEIEGENDESGGDTTSSKLQEKVDAMVNVSRVNAILQQVEEEKASLHQKLVIEKESRQELEDQIKHLQKDMEALRMNHSKAEKESADAMTKLSVLSSYFKEKELQMQKELGEQLTQKKAKEGALEDAGMKADEIEREMSMYRSQVDDLKKEIMNIERDFRNQIASNEKKAHENWLLARAAERELKEAKGESTILRQKLTDLERRREFMDPEGLIRPLPTRGLPPVLMNGPPPPPPGAPDRPTSRSSSHQPSPSPHMRDSEHTSPSFDRLPPPPLDRRPLPPPDRPRPPPGRMPLPMDRPLPPPLDRRGPPPPMMDMRSPPMDRRPSSDHSPPFEHELDRRYPPPPDRFPPNMPPPIRMGPPIPGGPPYPGPPMRGPPPPRRDAFPPEPYPDRQGPGRPPSIPPHERPPSLPPYDREHHGPPPPRERQQSFV